MKKKDATSSDQKPVEGGTLECEKKISVGQSLFYGFQSVLACNLFLGPIVIIGLLAMGVDDAASLISMTFLACGIATVIQAGFFMKYLVIQGMSFAVIGAIAAIAMGQDWGTVFGAIMVASVIIILLGVFKLYSKAVKVLIPGMVAAIVILVVGLALMPVSWNSLIAMPGDPGINFLEAGITLAVMIVFIRIGKLKSKVAKVISLGSVIYAIVIGTIFSGFFGHVDLSPVATAPWVALPQFLPFGPPSFDINAIIVMTVVMLIVLVESMGTWFVVSSLSGDPLKNKRIDRGVIGEGLGCFIGSFIGGMPVTSYGSNAGVLVVTKMYSRWAAVGAGVIAIVMAICPKLMYLIAVIPESVIWGIYGYICIAIMMSGLAALRKYPLTERNNLIIGTSVLMVIGASLLPPAFIQGMPELLSYLFGSAIIIGALTAIIMNLILPAKPEDQAMPEVIEQKAADDPELENAKPKLLIPEKIKAVSPKPSTSD